MKDLLLWNKISRIVMLLAECLDISPVACFGYLL